MLQLLPRQLQTAAGSANGAARRAPATLRLQLARKTAGQETSAQSPTASEAQATSHRNTARRDPPLPNNSTSQGPSEAASSTTPPALPETFFKNHDRDPLLPKTGTSQGASEATSSTTPPALPETFFKNHDRDPLLPKTGNSQGPSEATSSTTPHALPETFFKNHDRSGASSAILELDLLVLPKQIPGIQKKPREEQVTHREKNPTVRTTVPEEVGRIALPGASDTTSLPRQACDAGCSTSRTAHHVPPKLKHYFLSRAEEEEAVSFRQHCNSIKLTDKKTPPGSADEFESPSEACNAIMTEVAGLFVRLHKDAKKSLKGKFTLDDLSVTATGQVKLNPSVKLRTRTTARATRDFHTLAEELRANIFNEAEPPEIKFWLDFLASERSGKQGVCAQCSACLMAQWNKISYYNWMYSRLWGFMTNNPIKFKQVVSAIPYARHWKTMACRNYYLYKIYYAKDKFGNIRSLYTSDAEGLLRFIRNAIAHSSEILAKYRISEWEISDIITSTFPSLLGSLQKALADSGELESPEVKLAKHMMG